jgi:leucyl aminopeptidase
MSQSPSLKLPSLFPNIEVKSSSESPQRFEGDTLVLGLGDDWKLSKSVVEIDAACGKLIDRMLQSEDLSTKLNKIANIPMPSGLKVRNLLIVGLGEKDKRDAGSAYRAAASAAKATAALKNRLTVGYCGFDLESDHFVHAVTGSLVGGFGQDIFRNEPSLRPPKAVVWYQAPDPAIEQGRVLAESINLTRSLVNLPANYVYPESFAEQASLMAKDAGFSIEIWDAARLRAERCESLLAVARGSVREPRLCIMRYDGTDSKAAPLALVGKGVTFDSGGYSIKPTDGMLTMKCDMAGAATVVGIMRAAAKLKLARPIVGLVGLVENMVSGDAFKLGDVLTSRSGKTIEIHNTDAEGRLVLADVLNVALDYKPSEIVDFATLTGACVVALGNDIAGAMTNHNAWQEKLLAAARVVGEYVWPLPMYSFFNEQITGKVADIKNVGEGRWGGAITAAKFLEEFVGNTPWVHLDIAGPAFLDSPKPWSDAGATGVMVRTIMQLLDGIA